MIFLRAAISTVRIGSYLVCGYVNPEKGRLLTENMRFRVFERLFADSNFDREGIIECCSCGLNSLRICPWGAFGLRIPRDNIIV